MAEPVFSKPPPSGDHEPPPKRKRYWWRFTLGSVVIVAVVAAATSISILRFFGSIADALSHNGALTRQLKNKLAKVNGGGPENILIIGSDKRANLEEDPGRSDTTILLRLDPDRNAIAVMSIPRDLKVEIPGFGTEKFNAAYTYGGPKLTLQVVKELTGLPINHVVNVDFLGFVRAVDAIGCVYTDVDRRYYHSNVGVPASEQYSEINIKPGYQLLCGKRALEYVRYRHTDTDIVRSARQQDFLSAARQRVPIKELLLGQNNLIDIFTQYTTSDISDTGTMIQVLDLFIESRNAAIKEVHFPAELGPSYVYATPEAIQEAVNKFLGIEASEGPRGSLDEGRSKSAGGHKSKKKHSAPKPHIAKPKPPGSDGLVPAREAGEARGEVGRPQGQRRLPRLLPDAPAVRRLLRRKQPLRTRPGPARLPPARHRRQPPRRLPDGRRAAALRRHPLLRPAGDPGLVGPADPRQPEPDEDDQRARIRHLRRRRPDPDRRLAPGGQQLLGLE